MRPVDPPSKRRTITRHCITELSNLEPWRGYFRFRATEFEILLHHARIQPIGTVLEVGCGLGFVSALWSTLAQHVLATDLSEANSLVHAKGLEHTQRFLKTLGVKRVKVFPASATRLDGISSGHVDVVYCSQVLEHIAVEDRRLALEEMYRVLKPDGTLLLTVPNFMERVWATLQFYFSRPAALARFVGKSLVGPVSGGTSPAASSMGHIVRVSLLPPPHGLYRNSWEEMSAHRPNEWNKLVQEAGFTIRKCFTHKLTVPWSAPPFDRVFEAMLGVEKALGAWPLLRTLGRTYCILATSAE